MAKKKGVIVEAKLCDIYDLYRRKPRGLGFNDTDVVVVKAKCRGDKSLVQENFFTSLKGRGTFSLDAPSRLSEASRGRLARFMAYYKITNEPEEYDLRKNIGKWKNRDVEIVRDRGGRYIYVP